MEDDQAAGPQELGVVPQDRRRVLLVEQDVPAYHRVEGPGGTELAHITDLEADGPGKSLLRDPAAGLVRDALVAVDPEDAAPGPHDFRGQQRDIA
jgi:hypothetical protein